MAKALVTYYISDYMGPNAPDVSEYQYRFLAEGDSWFTIGALNPAKNSNLLMEMEFSVWSVAVSAALPGDTLRRMAQMNRDPRFAQLLGGALSERWDAILLSAGGNDLIDALQSPPGSPLDLRLLRTQAEWGPPSQGAARYVSEAGMQTFGTYLGANLDALLALRDRGRAAGRPVCMHTYAIPTPRPAGAGLGLGPWLMPSLVKYGIPAEDWGALAAELLGGLGKLLKGFAADQGRFPGLDVFDTAALPLAAAAPGSKGASGDWVNEIHLTRKGCEKLAEPWSAHIEALVAPD
jgi:hypothetical protein